MFCRSARRVGILLAGAGLLLVAGCQTPAVGSRPEADIAAAARPILAFDPHAVWTDHFNRLVEHGPAAIAWLMEQSAMGRPAAPDDLNVLLHTSLIRLLADPASRPPPLSATCLETTLGLLHFDLKADGRRLGTVVWADETPPRAWHDLYPADFDHAPAATIDVEADRRALRAWWLAQQERGARVAVTRRLEPRAVHLWRILSRRHADLWEYQPEWRAALCAAGPRGPRLRAAGPCGPALRAAESRGAALCAAGPRGPALLEVLTQDYNLVRAACVWLGSCGEPDVQRQLIELVACPLPTVAHNARFSLGYSPDPRIRSVLERYAEAR